MKKIYKVFGYIFLLTAFTFTFFNSVSIIQSSSSLNYLELKVLTAKAYPKPDCYENVYPQWLQCPGGEFVIR